MDEDVYGQSNAVPYATHHALNPFTQEIMAKPLRLLFVCSGNLHRSVMSSAITAAMFQQLNRPALCVSAGTLGLQGQPAPEEVVTVCAELGLDVSGHSSQGLNRSLIQNADWIVAMAENHGDVILSLAPGAHDRLVFLGDYAEPEGDIWDPIGQDLAAFRRNRDHILAALQRWLPVCLEREA